MKKWLAMALCVGAAWQTGCDGGVGLEGSTEVAPLSWEQFLAQAHQDADGVYVVDGDIPVHSIEALHAYYTERFSESGVGTKQSGLTVSRRANGSDELVAPERQHNYTYCINMASFGARYQETVDAMRAAAAAWEEAASVKFVHVVSLDTSCGPNTPEVAFNVQGVKTANACLTSITCDYAGAIADDCDFNKSTCLDDAPGRWIPGTPQYYARAFFPDWERSKRQLNIDASSYGNLIRPGLSLAGILRHELGHSLGFRHEQVQVITDTTKACYESGDWRNVNGYDQASVMHYPQTECSGNGTWSFQLTAMDKQGAAILYPASRATQERTYKSPIELKWESLGGKEGFGAVSKGEAYRLDLVGRAAEYLQGTAERSIFWHPDVGAHFVWGGIRALFLQLGAEQSLLGYPTTDESPTPVGGGSFNRFQGGAIYWSPNTGSQYVLNRIRDRWAQLGLETGVLGFPTTSELGGADGSRYNHFQGGTIYWHPARGAIDVTGAIQAKWLAYGFDTGFGAPLGFASICADGVTLKQTFGNRIIYSHPTRGASALFGPTLTEYQRRLGERGRCGYPVGDTVTDGSYSYTNFTKGTIDYDPSYGISVFGCR